MTSIHLRFIENNRVDNCPVSLNVMQMFAIGRKNCHPLVTIPGRQKMFCWLGNPNGVIYQVTRQQRKQLHLTQQLLMLACRNGSHHFQERIWFQGLEFEILTKMFHQLFILPRVGVFDPLLNFMTWWRPTSVTHMLSSWSTLRP